MKKNNNLESIDNKCFECVYGAKHYVNLNGTFQKANCMHCINGDILLHSRKKRIENRETCEFWQPEKKQIEQRHQSIEQYLQSTAQKLNEIAQILKEDSKNKNSP